MNLADIDNAHGDALRRVVQRLETMTRTATLAWNPEQRAAALADIADARRLLGTDILTAAGRAVIARKIDRVEADTDRTPVRPACSRCNGAGVVPVFGTNCAEACLACVPGRLERVER